MFPASALNVALLVGVFAFSGHPFLAFAVEHPATEEYKTQEQVAVRAVIESRLEGEAPDDIGRKLERLDQPKESKYSKTLIDPALDHWNDLTGSIEASTGITLGMAYTSLYQRLSDTREGENKPDDGAAGDLDIFGEWTLPGGQRSWKVGFQMEARHRILTSDAPADLGSSAGSLWSTTVGFNSEDASLIQLWWQQGFFNDALRLRVGEIDQSQFTDVGTLASANLFFTNGMFADNPAVAFPGDGLGAAVNLRMNENWYAVLGTGDANGKRSDIDFSPSHDDFFSAAEVGYTPEIDGLGQGFYQLTFWDSDGSRETNGRRGSSGNGFALRFEQFLGEKHFLFTSYAKASGRATSVRELATIGFGKMDIFSYQEDLIGLAIGWGKPEDGTLRDQYVGEIFYRMQITDFLQVTPDLQIIVDPSRNKRDDEIIVFGLRLRLDF